MKLKTLATTFLLTACSFAAPIAQQNAHADLAELQSKRSCGMFKGEMWFPVRPRPDGSCPTTYDRKTKDEPEGRSGVNVPGASSYRPRRCGRYDGEMWVPMPPKPDGSCPSWRDDRPSKRSDGNERRNLPLPCGRFIGETWLPMKRRVDGTCPPGSDIRERDDSSTATTESFRLWDNGEEWRDPMPGPVMPDRDSKPAVPVREEQGSDMVAEALHGDKEFA